MTVVYINAVQYQTCPNHESDNHFFAKIPGGVRTPGPPPLDPPLVIYNVAYLFKSINHKTELLNYSRSEVYLFAWIIKSLTHNSQLFTNVRNKAFENIAGKEENTGK